MVYTFGTKVLYLHIDHKMFSYIIVYSLFIVLDFTFKFLIHLEATLFIVLGENIGLLFSILWTSSSNTIR